ncbi:uncharacterized protein RHO17_002986 [Thomomys bottae]
MVETDAERTYRDREENKKIIFQGQPRKKKQRALTSELTIKTSLSPCPLFQEPQFAAGRPRQLSTRITAQRGSPQPTWTSSEVLLPFQLWHGCFPLGHKDKLNNRLNSYCFSLPCTKSGHCRVGL